MRVIRVKETGNISIKPDLTIISMKLETIKDKYEDAMGFAAEFLKSLEDAIISIGFKKEDLKTSNFSIRTHYENYYDEKNNYKKKFNGYICNQDLKLEFDFDTVLLGQVISAIGKSQANPEIHINFSVRDKDRVKEKLLEEASVNARRKAEVLAQASNKRLGELVSIEYNWDEIHLYSPSKFDMTNRAMALADNYPPDITPEDIRISDTVLFVWELE